MPLAKTIEHRELAALLASNDLPVVLDVLPAEYFAARHIPGARNLCVYEAVFGDAVRQALPDTDATIAVYSASSRCLGAADAAAKLLHAGYGHVLVLQDGLEGWIEAGLPLEGHHGPEPVAPDHLETSAARLDLDLTESRIEWTGRSRNGRHFGVAPLSEGELRFWKGRLVHGAFVVDMESLHNEDLKDVSLATMLINHLKSIDFFQVDAFPEARFDSTALTPVAGACPGMPNFAVEGQLTLRGVTREVRFPATVERLEDGRLAVEAHFDLDRTRWGANYGSGKFFEKLGMHLVHDIISIQVRLVTAAEA